jgi:hypothetical protein
MPSSFISPTQVRVSCDMLLPRVDTITTGLAVTDVSVGVVLQLQIHSYEPSTALYPPSSTVAAVGSSGINTTSTHGRQSFSFTPTGMMLTRPATLSDANVNVPSTASAANQANGASDVVPAISSASYPPSSTVAAVGSSGINTTSTHGRQSFSFTPTGMMLTRPATLSDANGNVPSWASAINEAHVAHGAAPPVEPTGGLSLPEEVRSSGSSAANANIPSNGSNAPRRYVRAKRPTMLTRPSTLSGAHVNVPSSASVVDEAHGAHGAAPPAEPTSGLFLSDEARLPYHLDA